MKQQPVRHIDGIEKNMDVIMRILVIFTMHALQNLMVF